MASVTLQGLSKNFGSVAAVASLDLAVAWRRCRHEHVEQSLRRGRDLVDRVGEGVVVRPRGL